MMTLLLSLSLTALAGTPAQAVDAVLDDFTAGAAARDVARVRGALHPEARQFIAMPDGLQVMDRTAYLALLEAGEIGGTETTRTVQQIEIDGNRATARQVRDMGAMALHDTVSLMQTDSTWLIVSASIEVEQKAGE